MSAATLGGLVKCPRCGGRRHFGRESCPAIPRREGGLSRYPVPSITGMYIHTGRAGPYRYEVMFAFEGEVFFETEADAKAAKAEYEKILRETLGEA